MVTHKPKKFSFVGSCSGGDPRDLGCCNPTLQPQDPNPATLRQLPCSGLHQYRYAFNVHVEVKKLERSPDIMTITTLGSTHCSATAVMNPS